MPKNSSIRAAAVTCFALALVALASVALAKDVQPVASPNSLRFSGAPQPISGPILSRPPRAPEALINDGSFENGPPPGSAWTETTNSACEWIGDWSGVWGAGAYDGSQDFWAGGYCSFVPATSSVSQAGIPIPVSDNNLRFWYMSYRPDPDDPAPDDYAYAEVNGSQVWSLDLTQANDTFPNWVEVVVSMAAYAGQSVTLEFGAVSTGAQTGNIRFDYIQIGDPPPPPPRCPDGYAEITVLPTEGFEGSFPPTGWTAADNTTGCVSIPGWSNSDAAGRGNLTGASGLFAIADSDACLSGVAMDAELWTPVIDLSNLVAPEVSFNLDYFRLSDTATLDASTDAGGTWGNVYTWNASARGPRVFTAAIPGAGEPDVVLRWHYVAGWDWWWEIDDVTITACEFVGGGEPGPTVLEIPTISKVGMALLGLLLASAAFVLIRRR